jgi:hypothetical protein
MEVRVEKIHCDTFRPGQGNYASQIICCKSCSSSLEQYEVHSFMAFQR